MLKINAAIMIASTKNNMRILWSHWFKGALLWLSNLQLEDFVIMTPNQNGDFVTQPACEIVKRDLPVRSSWSIKVSIAAQNFAPYTDCKGTDTTWELRML